MFYNMVQLTPYNDPKWQGQGKGTLTTLLHYRRSKLDLVQASQFLKEEVRTELGHDLHVQFGFLYCNLPLHPMYLKQVSKTNTN
jgi:hypothetical protein